MYIKGQISKIIIDIANAITFNGHDGIHRGGLTEKGERLMIFITWINKKSFIDKLFIKVKNLILKKFS